MRQATGSACLCLALLLSGTGYGATKTSVAVMSLKSASGVTADDAELLSDRLRIELFNTGQFSVMERSQMQDILKEQGFQQSGVCSDEGCMVEMGAILGVNLLLGGSIGRLGNMYLVNIRGIDIQTARITAVVSEDIPGSIENVVAALKRIAAKLAGKPVPAGAPPPAPAQPRAEPKSPPPPAGADSRPKCKEKVYLERTAFTAAQLGFSLTDEEMTKLNKEVTENIEEPLDVCLFDDVEIAGADELAAMPGCKSIVVRIRLLNYSTAPGTRDQVKGTAEVAVEFYDGTDATSPYHSETIKETGAQHWGEYEPFQNAFEEIAETLEGHDMSKQYMRDTRSKIRKL
jgi:TolB-like protein